MSTGDGSHLRWIPPVFLVLGLLVFSSPPSTADNAAEKHGNLHVSRPAVKLDPDLGDYSRGEFLATAFDCVKCHGPGGTGLKSGWPKLAGQFEQYLLNELRNFRLDHRPHVFMALYADQLTRRVMHDLALYYACQTDNPGVDDERRCRRN